MAGNAKKAKRGGSNWHWTNERHLHFLNSVEASFVQSMFATHTGPSTPPLDRYLPDSEESTLDLAKERRTRHSASDIVGSNGRRMDKRTRLLSSQKSSQDQVVPQFENKREDKDDKGYLDISHGKAH